MNMLELGMPPNVLERPQMASEKNLSRFHLEPNDVYRVRSAGLADSQVFRRRIIAPSGKIDRL